MRPMRNRWLGLAALTLTLSACGRSDDTRGVSVESPAEVASAPAQKTSLLEGLDQPQRMELPTGPASEAFNFGECAEELQLSLIYRNGDSPKKLMPAATSGGIGCIDVDRDGWPDLVMPQGGDLPWQGPSELSADELWRNVRGQKFESVTQQSSVSDSGYGHGVGVGDFDNDGFDDFYVSNVGEDALFRNLGDGTFENVTHVVRISNPAWASSVAFADLNSDGMLDIFVCNYVDYDPLHPVGCFDDKDQPATCHPKEVGDVPNRMFLNLGNGEFRECADERGLNAPGSKSLGVVAADFDQDGDQDVYVANDTEANHLLINDGSGQFSEEGVARGAAASGLGHYQASMGVAYGDYDRDGWTDLYVTHFIDDSNTLYRNLGGGVFSDETRSTTLHQDTLEYLAFGTAMCDFDADGWLDIFIANGHIDDWRDRTGDPWKMKAQLFRGKSGQWSDVSAASGPYFHREVLGRGVAVIDFDEDADPDLCVIHQNENVGLLRNSTKSGQWVKLDLVGIESNRNATGATISLRQGKIQWTVPSAGGGSYCSASQRTSFVGLGDSSEPCEVTVRWPSGKETRYSSVSVGRHYFCLEDGRIVH